MVKKKSINQTTNTNYLVVEHQQAPDQYWAKTTILPNLTECFECLNTTVKKKKK